MRLLLSFILMGCIVICIGVIGVRVLTDYNLSVAEKSNGAAAIVMAEGQAALDRAEAEATRGDNFRKNMWGIMPYVILGLAVVIVPLCVMLIIVILIIYNPPPRRRQELSPKERRKLYKAMEIARDIGVSFQM